MNLYQIAELVLRKNSINRLWNYDYNYAFEL